MPNNTGQYAVDEGGGSGSSSSRRTQRESGNSICSSHVDQCNPRRTSQACEPRWIIRLKIIIGVRGGHRPNTYGVASTAALSTGRLPFNFMKEANKHGYLL